jgi:hypothetical protein
MSKMLLTEGIKFLCFDVESNGLHGKAFAVGAVLMKASGEVIDEFEARCPIQGKVHPWVKENVLPSLVSLRVTHKNAKAMRRAFWNWYLTAKTKADYVLVDNGYPVEARFLIDCQDDALSRRGTDHPFPLLDLSTLLLQAGYEPLTNREQFVKKEIAGKTAMKHHPKWDAWVTTLAAIKALRKAGRLV